MTEKISDKMIDEIRTRWNNTGQDWCDAPGQNYNTDVPVLLQAIEELKAQLRDERWVYYYVQQIGVPLNFELSRGTNFDRGHYRWKPSEEVEYVVFSVGERSVWFLMLLVDGKDRWILQCNNKIDAQKAAENDQALAVAVNLSMRKWLPGSVVEEDM